MRHGTLEASTGGGGGVRSGWGGGDRSEEDSSDEEFAEGANRKLDGDREEGQEEEEIVLNAVGECDRRALSVSASLWQHVQGEDSSASAASSQRSPRPGGGGVGGGGGGGGGGEDGFQRRSSWQSQAPPVLAAAEHSSLQTQHISSGEGKSGVSDAAAGSAGGCPPAASAKLSTAQMPVAGVARTRNKGWVTCPPAWWANDSETAGEDAQQQVRGRGPRGPGKEPCV